MTLRIRFRPRPVSVRQVCTACESRRQWLRANGIRRWGPLGASCPACAARAAAIAPAACRDPGNEGTARLPLSA